MTDFAVLRRDLDNDIQNIDIITTKVRALERVEGCCSSLSPILQPKNLKGIMDVMRLSIGSTIPQSSLNSTNGFQMLERLFPLGKIATELKIRYI